MVDRSDWLRHGVTVLLNKEGRRDHNLSRRQTDMQLSQKPMRQSDLGCGSSTSCAERVRLAADPPCKTAGVYVTKRKSLGWPALPAVSVAPWCGGSQAARSTHLTVRSQVCLIRPGARGRLSEDDSACRVQIKSATLPLRNGRTMGCAVEVLGRVHLLEMAHQGWVRNACLA